MSTTTKHETEISAHPTLPIITITREFDAPVERVHQAHTDPELVARWTGPRSTAVRVGTWECRTGGSWAYTATEAGQEWRFFGSFHEVRPDRIIQTFSWEDADGVALETLWFEDLGDGRTRLRSQSLCDSIEGRDAMLSSGMDVGVDEGYEKLDELLARP
jgi:uncharacterized protein YndB with AHSA1/START domain